MEKMRQWAVLTTVVVAALLAGGWFLLVSPQKSRAAEIRTQTQGQLQTNSTLQSKIDQLRQLEKGQPAQQKLLTEIATKVPDNPALPALIRQLSKAAQGAGVELVTLAPGQPTAVTAAAPAVQTPAGGAAQPAPLQQIPLQITVTGNYFNIERFFRGLEHLSRAMLVTQWSLDPAAKGGAATGAAATGPDASAPDDLQGVLTASVFESPAVAAAVTTPAAPASTAPSAPAADAAPAE